MTEVCEIEEEIKKKAVELAVQLGYACMSEKIFRDFKFEDVAIRIMSACCASMIDGLRKDDKRDQKDGAVTADRLQVIKENFEAQLKVAMERLK